MAALHRVVHVAPLPSFHAYIHYIYTITYIYIYIYIHNICTRKEVDGAVPALHRVVHVRPCFSIPSFGIRGRGFEFLVLKIKIKYC